MNESRWHHHDCSAVQEFQCGQPVERNRGLPQVHHGTSESPWHPAKTACPAAVDSSGSGASLAEEHQHDFWASAWIGEDGAPYGVAGEPVTGGKWPSATPEEAAAAAAAAAEATQTAAAVLLAEAVVVAGDEVTCDSGSYGEGHGQWGDMLPLHSSLQHQQARCFSLFFRM